MFFDKKEKCLKCKSKVSNKYEFCPYCGAELVNREDYGMLGRNDSDAVQEQDDFLGFTDKLMGNLMSSLMKNLDKQFGELQRGDVQTFPNGISIRIGPHKQPKKAVKKIITDEQIEKMSSMPRAEAKTDVRRFGDRVVYELQTPGVESPDDIFISKLEQGYEVKAIGKKKVYVKSLPVELPLRGFALGKDKLIVEFFGHR